MEKSDDTKTNLKNLALRKDFPPIASLTLVLIVTGFARTTTIFALHLDLLHHSRTKRSQFDLSCERKYANSQTSNPWPRH